MTMLNDDKRAALHWLDTNAARLSGFHLAIWTHAEPVWREYRSAADYVEYTWHAPTVRLHTGKPVMRDPGDWAHWGNNALNASPRPSTRRGCRRPGRSPRR